MSEPTRGIYGEADRRDAKFVRFHGIVQAEARRRGCTFFDWAGEGRELITDELDGENLSGWLVGNEDVAEFEPQWEGDRMNIDERFADCMCEAVWSLGENGEVSIDFKFY